MFIDQGYLDNVFIELARVECQQCSCVLKASYPSLSHESDTYFTLQPNEGDYSDLAIGRCDGVRKRMPFTPAVLC